MSKPPYGNKAVDLRTLRKLLHLLRPHAAQALLALAAMSVASTGLLAVPLLVRRMLEASLGSAPAAPSLGLLAAMALVLAVLAAAAYFSSVLLHNVSRKVCATLRESYVSRWLSASVTAHRNIASGEFGERLNTSLADVDWFLKASLGNFLGVILLMAGGIFMLFRISWQLSLLALVVLPACVIALRAVEKTSRLLVRERRRLAESLAGMLQETVSGDDVIKAFGAEERVLGEFRRRQKPLLEVQRRESLIGSLVEPVLIATGAAVFLLILFFAATLMSRGAMTATELLTFLIYLMFILPNLRTLGLQLARWRHLGVALDFLEDASRLPPERDAPGARPLASEVRGAIVFEGVSFGYPGRGRVLDSLSFSVAAGECLGIVGASGAGKSTIFHLLLRFFAPDAGKILVDGQDIAGIERASLRRAFASVSQDPVLFDGSITDNLRLAKADASGEEIAAALDAARATEFVGDLPEGVETRVGERGVKLSAGQRQRLAIARALLRNAPILLLDEATSAMDPRTELLFGESVRNAMRGRTSLIIAHRLATIVQMPKLLFIHGGRVAGVGSHSELMHACADYRAVVGASSV